MEKIIKSIYRILIKRPIRQIRHFINKKGKIKIPAIYNKAFPFINGLAYVELDGKVGYINKTGNEIIPIKYKQLWFENDGVIRFAE